MKILVLDFLRRWWSLFIFAMLIAAVSASIGFPFIFAPAAVVALLLDAQRGVFRVVRPLPVPRLVQAKAWWFVGVVLLPLLSLPMLAIGVLIYEKTHPQTAMTMTPAPMDVETRDAPPAPTNQNVSNFSANDNPNPWFKPPAPWFAASVQTWVALGYAAMCFFVIQWLPTRPAESIAEHIQQGIAGGLWGLSMPSISILLPNLPRTPAGIMPWHWAIFIAAPIFVALSYLTAADVMQHRMFVTAVKARPQADSQTAASGGGFTGVPLFLLNFAGRLVLVLLAMTALQTIILSWITGGKFDSPNPGVGMQIVIMGLLMGVMITESTGLRALRVLPLSTPRLALLLALIPWTGALSAALFATLFGIGDRTLSPFLNLATLALAMCGWTTLTLAITLHLNTGFRVFLLGLFCAIPGACLLILQMHPPILAAIGTVSGIAGFALLLRGLKKSAAFYRPRGFFGMTPGQPSAVR